MNNRKARWLVAQTIRKLKNSPDSLVFRSSNRRIEFLRFSRFSGEVITHYCEQIKCSNTFNRSLLRYSNKFQRMVDEEMAELASNRHLFGNSIAKIAYKHHDPLLCVNFVSLLGFNEDGSASISIPISVANSDEQPKWSQMSHDELLEEMKRVLGEIKARQEECNADLKQKYFGGFDEAINPSKKNPKG